MFRLYLPVSAYLGLVTDRKVPCSSVKCPSSSDFLDPNEDQEIISFGFGFSECGFLFFVFWLNSIDMWGVFFSTYLIYSLLNQSNFFMLNDLLGP